MSEVTPASDELVWECRPAQTDLASEIAAAVMALPWASGEAEDEHCNRHGDIQNVCQQFNTRLTAAEAERDAAIARAERAEAGAAEASMWLAQERRHHDWQLLSPQIQKNEWGLIEKHCDWPAFQHALNALVKHRRERSDARAALAEKDAADDAA